MRWCTVVVGPGLFENEGCVLMGLGLADVQSSGRWRQQENQPYLARDGGRGMCVFLAMPPAGLLVDLHIYTKHTRTEDA